jgi:hypothetical protein
VTPRRRRSVRFAAVAAVIALIAALPTLAGARPAPKDRAVSAASLLARMRASGAEHYEGYAQSVGTAGIPDVADLGDLPSLLGDVTMLRVWWSSPSQWRVDKLSATSEDDTYGYPGGSWEWTSATNTAVNVTAVAPVRLLEAPDLAPDQLGRRLAALAGQPGVTARRDGARRIAGRTALGVVLTGARGTTVGAVQLWSDEATGVPLAASVTALGQSRPLLATTYLSFSATTPQDGTDTFTPPADATVQSVDDSALRGLFGRLVALPGLAQLTPGLTVEQQGATAGEQGVAVYGSGLSQVAAVGLNRGDAEKLGHDLGSAATESDLAGGQMFTVSTPLVNLALLDARGLHVLLVGTVPQATLTAALANLRAAAPSGFGFGFNGPPPGSSA